MKITLQRFVSNAHETIGTLFINGVLAAVTCEDEKRNVKLAGETRIWEGTYQIKFRTEGTHHLKYGKMFPEFHKGMLELQNVPQFKFILIHIGNTDADTEGCILVGEKFYITPGKLKIENSTLAYQAVYKPIAAALAAGEEVWITIESLEKPALK